MKRTSGRMATPTNKTAAFGVKLIHKCMLKHRYIQKNWLFGALYGLVESFFKNDEGHNVTVNGDRYRAMITNFFIPELNNHDVQELWFQQDGTTCHTARATIDLLKDTFGGRLISRFGHVNWPPRSCDLTPLDYFLWGYVKSLVYVDKPQTLDHLEGNIRRVIADMRPQRLEKVIENWTSGLDNIRSSRGSHMPEIIFKIPFSCELQGVKNGSQQRENSIIFTVFFDKGKKASQVAEIANGVYDADTVTANYVQFLFGQFRSGIFDVKYAPHTGTPVVENVHKITEIIEIGWHVSSRSISQELKIDNKTVLSHLRKVGFKKKLHVWVPHQFTTKNMMDRISICETLAKQNEIDPFL
ncbi:transposable element Tc3 transposase [Trichonephila clavipes]|nr:transposable element Tc3 transposase [Trichonephila clavipes]